MESYEVMREAVTSVGAKAVASDLSISSSLVYKWCEPSKAEGAAGADNPLDRLLKVYEATGDRGPIAWLCEKAGGFLVENPPLEGDTTDPLLVSTRRLLQEFSELLEAVSHSFEDDNKVDAKEAKHIRSEWEDLKRTGEAFVVACESGHFGGGN